MSSNFERLHEIINQAYAENFSILTQKIANPLLNPSLHFLIGIPFKKFLKKHLSNHIEKLHKIAFIIFFSEKVEKS